MEEEAVVGDMKIINQTKAFYILRFDFDEEVIKGITELCKRKNISSAFFSGLGACKNTVLSYYDLEEKEYLDKEYLEDLEIVSFTGNVGLLANSQTIHAHGVFSNKNYQTFGGHVKALTVSATCEIHLTYLPGKMKRIADIQTGLNLLG